ncbi:hypothetical protein SLEP1_g1261 [Rubroshorea leprosula]|uniref:SANT domain-containing protein n=1 Tax=Rubroshorea leprosula TaxID=152421 RepID=A0AAV5HP52_9ROSI|nr:hypothetical protein SLEP1_g1261 [Rubroshorea leprosula]
MGDIEDESAEQLLSSCTSMDDIVGDQPMHPYVGDQYQAEIPPLIAECHRLALINKPIYAEVPDSISVGLPIPLMWLNSEVERSYGGVEFVNSEESRLTSNNEFSEHKAEDLDSELQNEKDMRGYSNIQPTARGHQMEIDSISSKREKTKLDDVDRGLCPLPGSLGEPWKDSERDIFLLGLYIFGKNLIYVQKFVDTKTMGDVLSFYYGKFYRSDEYRRWAECRRLRTKRCINGQKLFTGWRQQELLSRLCSLVSKECQDTLLEVTKKLAEGNITYEEYAFAMKDTVGISAIVEAVGIGKGKQDLTCAAMEPVKTNNVNSVGPEIPVGKACSALSSADIIKFLTGGFRLSKARSSDLFWEAVWPRLLARGWHSEQPKDHGISGSRNPLVFLLPGVKKFSRRRLVKGNHYFDSVTDVLNRVASEPGLLEIEIEASKGSEDKDEHNWDTTIKQDTSGKLDKRHRYLKPRSSNCNREPTKFTIVDTSLAQGAERRRVRELRSLPVEAVSLFTPSSLSSDSGDDTSDESDNDTEETSTSNAAEGIADRATCADSSDCVNSIPNVGIPSTSNTTFVVVENHESHSTSLLDDKQQRKIGNDDFGQKVQSANSKFLAPITKQQDSTECINGESSCSIDNTFADRMLNGESSSPDALQMGPQNLSPASSLARGSPDGSKEGTVTENFLHKAESPEKPHPHTLIDLNISPHVSMDFETEPVITETVPHTDTSFANQSSFLSETRVQPEPSGLHDEEGTGVSQQPAMNYRRQSTRNRPLTTKALEALECGFLIPKRKKRASEAQPNISRRVRSRPVVSSIFRNGSGNSNLQENLDGLCSTTTMVDQSQT